MDRQAQPIGGVRLPDVDLPPGRLEPPALPPVTTESITATCGNFGGYQPYTAAELADQYGTVDRYEAKLRPLVERLVRRWHLLPTDRNWVIDELRTRYNRAAE